MTISLNSSVTSSPPPRAANESGARPRPVVLAVIDAPDAASLVAAEAASLAAGIGGRVLVLHAVVSAADLPVACWGLGWEAAWWAISVQADPGSDSAFDPEASEGLAAARGILDAAAVEHDVERRSVPHRASWWGRRRAIADLVVACAQDSSASAIVLRGEPAGRSRDVATLVRRRVTVPVRTVGSSDRVDAVLS